MGRPAQTVTVRTRPSMSLASALSLLENTSVGLAGRGQARRGRNLVESRARPSQAENVKERTRPSLRKTFRGRKVAAIPEVTNSVTLDSGEKTKKPGGSNAPGPTGYGYTRGSQEFVESWGR